MTSDQVDDTRQGLTEEELDLLREVLDHRTSSLDALFALPDETLIERWWRPNLKPSWSKRYRELNEGEEEIAASLFYPISDPRDVVVATSLVDRGYLTSDPMVLANTVYVQITRGGTKAVLRNAPARRIGRCIRRKATTLLWIAVGALVTALVGYLVLRITGEPPPSTTTGSGDTRPLEKPNAP